MRASFLKLLKQLKFSFLWSQTTVISDQFFKARCTPEGKSWTKFLAKQLAQPFPHVCGEFSVRNSPREAVRKISNYFLPREANSSLCAANMRIWLSQANRSSNKIAWHTHVTLKFAQPDSHVCRTQWGICLTRQKMSTEQVWYFPHGFARRIRRTRSPWAPGRTLEETAELPASRGILLSS